jgi:diguanylate cyclase (GGDEF)-like protein
MTMRAPTHVASLVRRGQWRIATFTIACVGLLLATAGLYASRAYEDRAMALVAQSLAVAGEPALRFDDKPAMQALLDQMADRAQLAEVSIVDRHGREWLHFERPGGDWGDRASRQLARLLIPAPATTVVGEAGDTLGSISLRSNGRTLLQYAGWSLLSLGACLAAFAVVVGWYSRSVARALVQPIDALATLTREIRETRAFDRRASGSSLREIHALAEDFNAFLAELQSHQEAIRQSHAGLERANASLRAASLHDPLTRLPNRAYLFEHLSKVVADCALTKRRAGLAFIDTDRFKEINDTYGHAAGDRVLVELADRLRASIRQSDFVARVGGDEFVVVLSPADADVDAAHLTDRIDRALEIPVRLPNGDLHLIGVSIGVAVFPDHADSVATLIQAADDAMYRQKNATRLARALPRINPESADH